MVSRILDADRERLATTAAAPWRFSMVHMVVGSSASAWFAFDPTLAPVSAEGSSPLPRIEVTATNVFGSVRVVSDDHPVGSEHTGDLDEADGPTTSEPTATSSDDDGSDGSVNDEAAQHHKTTPEASSDDDGSST